VEDGAMISIDDFIQASIQLGRDFTLDPGQNSVIRARPDDSLLIKAGPGSGKTTVIVLKILKNILVDDVDPSSILATTFTKKAAAELKSRILGWGDQMRFFLLNNFQYSPNIIWKMNNINFNAVTIGTIDSISQEILTDNRGPGNSAPIIIEPFVTEALMTRFVLLSRGLYNDATLGTLIGSLMGGSTQVSVRDRSATLIEVKERCIHDMIDIQALRNASPIVGTATLCDAIETYNQELSGRLLFDYSRLEREFLTRLVGGSLGTITSQIKYIVVDEYQDTNAIQEQIYFQLASSAITNGGSISVVGDDDQSIYHFRGATVELFSQLPTRIRTQLGISLREIPLSINYRSTQNIVNFCNDFAFLDAEYQTVRLVKPRMTLPPVPNNGLPRINPPVLGMFRDTVGELSQSMAELIDNVVNQTGFQFADGQGNQYNITLNPAGGTPSDIAVLCSSPEEFDKNGNPRLPNLLRNDLQMLATPLNVYNPRGQNLRTIPEVENLCGMLLECIDPNSIIQNQIRMPNDATNQMNAWRTAARNYITLPSNNSIPNKKLTDFVRAWSTMTPLNRTNWEQEVSLLDLTYKLVTWIPNMQDDIEGLVYLEAISRAISQAGFSSQYDSSIYFNLPNQRNQASVKEVINNIFVPIALGAIEVNEDLLQTIPPNRINVMSMHQAKGLEFPLVMVDIGSEFKTRHQKQEFKRFPNDGGKTCNIEDFVRPYSTNLGAINRSQRDRAFDDLYRKFFVGFSRARDILVLVGLTSVRDGIVNARGIRKNIENVASGFDRNGNWVWRPGLANLIQI
jgi:DNA helicase-2/ATP-dependent DNA helicase PcrA